MELHLSYVESELQKSAWLVGDALTGADFQMCFTLEAATQRGGLDQRYPKARAYLDKIHARPAYKQAIAKGGPNAYA